MSYPSPQIHHPLTFQRDADRCPKLVSLLEISLKLLCDSLESWIAEPRDLAIVDTFLECRKARHNLVLPGLLSLHQEQIDISGTR